MLKQNKKDSGFTLIEVIIVIAIIAILFVSAPNFSQIFMDQKLKGCTRDIYSNMQKAKSQAIKDNVSIKIRFDNTSSPGFYYFDLDDDSNHDAGEFKIELSSYGNSIDFGTGNASKNWYNNNCSQAGVISFMPRGLATAASVYLEDSRKTICYAISTSISGRVKIRKYNGNLSFNTNYWIDR